MAGNDNIGLAMLFGIATGLMMGFLAVALLSMTINVGADATNPMRQLPFMGALLGWTGILGPETFTGEVTLEGLGPIFFVGFIAIIFFSLMVTFIVLILVGAFVGFADAVLGIFMVFAIFLDATFFVTFIVGRAFIGMSV